MYVCMYHAHTYVHVLSVMRGFACICMCLPMYVMHLSRYDSSKCKWEGSEPMKTLRSRVGVAVVDKKLYAFGGYDGSARLITVECFNPQVQMYCMYVCTYVHNVFLG